MVFGLDVELKCSTKRDWDRVCELKRTQNNAKRDFFHLVIAGR